MKSILSSFIFGWIALIIALLLEVPFTTIPNLSTRDVPLGKVKFQMTEAQAADNLLIRKIKMEDAVLSSSESDIGNAMSCFDNNPNTIMRSASINPAFVEASFSERKSVRQIRVLLGQPGYPSIDKNNWRLEAADSQDDLDSQIGSYKIVVANRIDVAGTWDDVMLSKAVEKKIWRFWITRTVGDDYVHIPELELWTDLDIPEGIDLDVTYVSREPRYAWDSEKVLPDAGEPVTLTAHIINKGSQDSGPFEFEWMINGEMVENGIAESLPAQGVTIQEYTWKWESGRHHIGFRVDPQNLIDEISDTNNAVEDATDALSIAFWVEESVYEEFNSRKNITGSYSWEDWSRQIIDMANWMFEYSKYPSSPNGILARVRLDKVSIVPDGTLFNLNSSHAPQETTSDGQWGFSVQEYRDAPDDWLNVPWWVIHELGHQIFGLVDHYGMDVQDIDVHVTDDDGAPIEGTLLLPYLRWDIVHEASRIYDLMHSPTPYSVLSDHSAYYINKYWNKGQRSHRIFGSYLYEIPKETKLRVLDGNDVPMANVSVAVYQASGGNGLSGPYSQSFDNTPDIIGATDAQGLFSIGSKPFPYPEPPRDPEQGHILYNVSLIALQDSIGVTRYTWLEVVDLNMAYWQGDTDLYIHDLYFPEDANQLILSKNKLIFSAQYGSSNPAPQNVHVNVLGRDVLYWKVAPSRPSWLITIPSPNIALGYDEYPSGPLTFIVDSSGLAPGTYSTGIKVNTQNDSDVLNSPQTVKVTLNVAPNDNQPPDADFTFLVDGLTVQFSNTSTDPDGTITLYRWDFGDGTTTDETNPSHTYKEADSFAVCLTVTDEVGASASVTKSVIIYTSANIPPEVNFEYIIKGLTVSFTQLCNDTDGLIQRYFWDFGDGSSSTEKSPEHVYGGAGDYTVQLIVEDDNGAQSTKTEVIQVQTGSAQPGNRPSGSGSGCLISNLH